MCTRVCNGPSPAKKNVMGGEEEEEGPCGISQSQSNQVSVYIRKSKHEELSKWITYSCSRKRTHMLQRFPGSQAHRRCEISSLWIHFPSIPQVWRLTVYNADLMVISGSCSRVVGFFFTFLLHRLLQPFSNWQNTTCGCCHLLEEQFSLCSLAALEVLKCDSCLIYLFNVSTPFVQLQDPKRWSRLRWSSHLHPALWPCSGCFQSTRNIFPLRELNRGPTHLGQWGLEQVNGMVIFKHKLHSSCSLQMRTY